MNEIPLTSLSIYTFQAENGLTDEILAEISNLDKENKIDWAKDEEKINHGRNGYMNELGDKLYYNEKLYKWLTACVNQVSESVYKRKLEIVDLWPYKTAFLTRTRKHWHSHSILSGVFHLQDCKNSDIIFHYKHPDLQRLEFFFPDDTPNIFSTKSLKTSKGTLIIFPSNLLHSVNTHNEPHTRYSVAFNTFFADNICLDRTSRLILRPKNIIEQNNDQTP